MSAADKPGPISLRLHYMGVCSLLGRLSNRDMDADDLTCVERALADCAALFPGSFEVVSTSRGGFSLEPIFAKATGSAT